MWLIQHSLPHTQLSNTSRHQNTRQYVKVFCSGTVYNFSFHIGICRVLIYMRSVAVAWIHPVFLERAWAVLSPYCWLTHKTTKLQCLVLSVAWIMECVEGSLLIAWIWKRKTRSIKITKSCSPVDTITLLYAAGYFLFQVETKIYR